MFDNPTEDEDSGLPSQQPPSINCHPTPPPCFFFHLPIEIRNKIYRYFVLSRLDCRSHPRLWRPLGIDRGISSRIGYFAKDEVIPLLLLCSRIHDEAAAVLYGENTFAFHISGLAEGPLAFFEWLAPRYVRLLRKVYIRTGYHVDTYGYQQESTRMHAQHIEPTPEMIQFRASRDLRISMALMKQAWPPNHRVFVNKDETILYSSQLDNEIVKRQKGNDWPASSCHLWKMFVTDTEAENPRKEFKRIVWERRA